jgi:hypothetical protein
VRLLLIQPGKPAQNAFSESINGKFHDQCLNEHWFVTLGHAKAAITAGWMARLQRGPAAQRPRQENASPARRSPSGARHPCPIER